MQVQSAVHAEYMFPAMQLLFELFLMFKGLQEIIFCIVNQKNENRIVAIMTIIFFLQALLSLVSWNT